jgi:hypothetical protein
MAYRWLFALSVALTLAAACAEETDRRPFSETGGSGGVGAGGAGGIVIPPPTPVCETSPLCRACPSTALCDVDTDCGDGYACINTGCNDLDGLSIRQCAFAGGSACNTDADCSDDRRCVDLGEIEGHRCIANSPGSCTKAIDCVLGFECEVGTCVDRRVPCILDDDCPMNHTCYGGQQNGDFCLRIHVGCDGEQQCVGRGLFCENVDGDELDTTECTGSIELNPESGACTNDRCTEPGAPVCEAVGVSSVRQCGTHGLCRGPSDCAAGFVCVELWPDERKECVREGGTCSSFADCPVNQICAASRDGDPPTCQVGNLDGGE